LWRRTPGTEAETLLDLTCTARASRHRHPHTVT
jgi:hypothetical protein